MTTRATSQLDLAAYLKLSQRYRPTDPEAIRLEALRLHKFGLQPRDIAECLKIGFDDAVNIIAGRA